MFTNHDVIIRAGNWLSPPEEKSRRRLRDRTRSKMRWATLKKNGLTVFFVVLYFLVNAGLFIWVAIQRKDEGGWVIVARVHGMCLNFNSMFILVLMMKHSLTWLRSTRIGKYFPIDHHIAFHKAVAVVIFIQGVLHFIGHLGRYSKYSGGKEESRSPLTESIKWPLLRSWIRLYNRVQNDLRHIL